MLENNEDEIVWSGFDLQDSSQLMAINKLFEEFCEESEKYNVSAGEAWQIFFRNYLSVDSCDIQNVIYDQAFINALLLLPESCEEKFMELIFKVMFLDPNQFSFLCMRILKKKHGMRGDFL